MYSIGSILMPQVTVYIRQEDMDAWRAVERKSEWMHERLEGGAVRAVQARPKITETPDDRPVVVNLGTGKPVDFTEADEEEEFWKRDWRIDRATGGIVDITTQEYVDGPGTDAVAVNWLKKNNRYV